MTEKKLHQFHKLNKTGDPTGVNHYAVYNYLKNSEKLFLIGNTVFHYEKGVYVPDLTGAWLKTKIMNLIYPAFITSKTIEQIYNLFSMNEDLQKKAEDLNAYPKHWINFTNGFYDPVKQEMIPSAPSYLAVNQIPHEYHPERSAAPDPVIDEWLQFILPDPDDREMLLQYIGYCMTPDTRQQKLMIITGVGGSGKSTLLRMIDNIIGAENISRISLKQLSEKHASIDLMGKLLNSCADLEIDALKDTSVVKKILGEDTIRGEAKYKNAIAFRSYARLLFSTNELPTVLSEKSNGFYRRLLIIQMNNRPETPDPYFMEKLEAGTDYFIRLTVEALERLHKAGSINESDNSKDSVDELWNDSDSVKAWINDRCYTGEEAKYKPRPMQLYKNYDSYCTTTDRTPLKQIAFFKSLKAKGYDRRKSNGYLYYKGLDLKDPFE